MTIAKQPYIGHIVISPPMVRDGLSNWAVTARDYSPLGEIKWCGVRKQYAFFPFTGVYLYPWCLQVLGMFCAQESSGAV